MSPSAFTFKLTVPNDPGVAEIVAGVAAHAAEYAQLEAAAAAGFVDRVRKATGRLLQGGGGPACLALFVAADGTLTVTIGGETISQPLA